MARRISRKSESVFNLISDTFFPIRPAPIGNQKNQKIVGQISREISDSKRVGNQESEIKLKTDSDFGEIRRGEG